MNEGNTPRQGFSDHADQAIDALLHDSNDRTPFHTILLDRDQNIIGLDHSFASQFAIESGEILDKPIDALLAGCDELTASWPPAGPQRVCIASDNPEDIPAILRVRQLESDHTAWMCTLHELRDEGDGATSDLQGFGLPALYVDHEWNIQSVNNAYCSVYSLSRDELIDTSLVSTDQQRGEREYAAIRREVESGDTWQGEVDISVGQQTRTVLRSVTHAGSGPLEGGCYVVDVDLTDRAVREEELERRCVSLERLHHITRNLRPIRQSIRRATTDDALETLLCEKITLADIYRGAWYGQVAPGERDITVGASAGVDEGFVESFISDSHLQDRIDHALRSRSVVTEQHVLRQWGDRDLRSRAMTRGIQSWGLIPIVVGGTVHGILGLFSDRPDAFDQMECTLLEEVGELVGDRYRSIADRRLLHTDTAIELEFEEHSGYPVLSALSNEADAVFEVESLIEVAEGIYHAYLRISETAKEGLLEAADDMNEVESITQVTWKGVDVCEIELHRDPTVTLRELGAIVTAARYESGKARIVTEVPPDADVKRIVGELERQYPDMTLVAKRVVNRHSQERTAPAGVRDALTDRQRQALQLSFWSGYFDMPRQIAGDELAEKMDISPPTFYEHVRRGIQNVLSELHESESIFED